MILIMVLIRRWRGTKKHGGQTRALEHVAFQEDDGREDFQLNLSNIVGE
jgi:hypothetical protein